MAFDRSYDKPEPSRDDVERWTGPALLEFGAPWCGYCQAVQEDLRSALSDFPEVRHVKIADGPGKPLGRSYRVKLWPTLIFLKDGREIARTVRPEDAREIREGLMAAVSDTI
jgi:thioredoxin 1